MRVTKVVPVPAKTITVLDYIKCDLCGAMTRNENWSPKQYEVTQPEVTLKIGSNYPEGGYHTETICDICPNCFEQKLIPWFKSQGGIPRTEEHDW